MGLALWNGRDPILKERLFGLTNAEGNHGEDVKEAYYYTDGVPSHASMAMLYKYPQAEFPYARLLAENAARGLDQREFELADTGAFDGGRYFDVAIDYAKAGVDDLCMRITATNRGPDAAPLHILPHVWFRNIWSWDQDAARPEMKADGAGRIALWKNVDGIYTADPRRVPDAFPIKSMLYEEVRLLCIVVILLLLLLLFYYYYYI